MRDHYEAFTELAAHGTAKMLFAKIEDMCRDLVGVKLFTAMSSDLEKCVAKRIYTNDPVAYPVFGEKPIETNRWSEQVLDRRETFFAETVEELRDVFPDHEKIESLGVGATINIPIIFNARVLGTLNLLDVDGRYSAASVDALTPVRLPSIIAFLAAQNET